MESNLYHQLLISWVREVFSKENFDKIDIELPDCDSTGGYASEMIFVNVFAEKNGIKNTFNIVIKRSKEVDLANDPLDLKQLNANEHTVYSNFVPYFKEFAKDKNVSPYENISNCYGTIAKENIYLIIMENVKQKGFKLHPLEKPLNLDHVELVLEAYPKWHALCFAIRDQRPEIFEELRKCNKLSSESKIFPLMISTNQKEIDFVISLYEKKDKLVFIEKLRMLKEKYEEYLKNLLTNKDEDYLVFRHGDCWNNNLMFHYDDTETPDKTVVVDWQLSVPASPLTDVTQFLFYCCTRQELQHIDELLNLYYCSLSKMLRQLGSYPEKCFPEEIMKSSFRRYAPFAIAGMPWCARIACSAQVDKEYDVSNAVETGNFNEVFGDRLRDVDEYFTRIDGILELCIERGFI